MRRWRFGWVPAGKRGAAWLADQAANRNIGAEPALFSELARAAGKKTGAVMTAPENVPKEEDESTERNAVPRFH
jgi:hypothetical protein